MYSAEYDCAANWSGSALYLALYAATKSLFSCEGFPRYHAAPLTAPSAAAPADAMIAGVLKPLPPITSIPGLRLFTSLRTWIAGPARELSTIASGDSASAAVTGPERSTSALEKAISFLIVMPADVRFFLKIAKPSELNLSSCAYISTTLFTLSFDFATFTVCGIAVDSPSEARKM